MLEDVRALAFEQALVVLGTRVVIQLRADAAVAAMMPEPRFKRKRVEGFA